MRILKEVGSQCEKGGKWIKKKKGRSSDRMNRSEEQESKPT